ncbi:hypothetical protein BVRB_4g088400 [Beta vulgaris subsp. vulgaris]|nr:hypothetical protein BVRB_4g088400 [Beta vulgaris subsp. vulgaris]
MPSKRALKNTTANAKLTKLPSKSTAENKQPTQKCTPPYPQPAE